MSGKDAHILFAYAFDGQGGATPLSGGDISAGLKDGTLAWVHMFARMEPS